MSETPAGVAATHASDCRGTRGRQQKSRKNAAEPPATPPLLLNLGKICPQQSITGHPHVLQCMCERFQTKGFVQIAQIGKAASPFPR